MIQSISVKLSTYFLCVFLLIGCSVKSVIASNPINSRIIYIYNDKGTSKTGIKNCRDALSALDPQLYVVKEINALQTISGEWCKDAAAFIMPGGADLPYCKKLNGEGNAQIKAYVEAGGTYIGFCAGAYYGAHYCEFHKGDTRGYEVLGERELSFFPGSAVGPVLAPYDYKSKSGARIAQIKWKQSDVPTDQIYNVYFNGGCYFKDADQYENIRVLATYNNEGFEGLAAVVECQIGQGKALLCGVHPECSFDDLEENDQNLSAEDQNHLRTHIIPHLSDRSHKTLFTLLMNHIQ
ncbi:MAG: BPL-N domain-containing protein [Pseudomonadota bacterium]